MGPHFSREYFADPIFFPWVFREIKLFSCGYFVGPKFCLVGILRVQNFSSWVFCGSNFFPVDIPWVTRDHIKEE